MDMQQINYFLIENQCKQYCCGRTVAFLSSLISYLKSPKNKKEFIDAKIYTDGDNVINLILSSSDVISNSYLFSKSNNKIAVKISSISEIIFNEKIYINEPLDGTFVDSDIILKIPNILPPEDAIEMTMTKQLIDKSIKGDTVKMFDRIKLSHFTLFNKNILSITEGMLTINTTNGGSIFAPFSSIESLTSDFIY